MIEGSKDGYPELEEKKDFIFKVLAQEEEKFDKTIDQGLSILTGMEADMEKNGERCCPASMHSPCMIPTDSRWI